MRIGMDLALFPETNFELAHLEKERPYKKEKTIYTPAKK